MSLKEKRYGVIIKCGDKIYMNIEYKEGGFWGEGVYEGIPIRLNDNGIYELRYGGFQHCYKSNGVVEGGSFTEGELKQIYESEIGYREWVNSLIKEYPEKIKENEEKIRYLKEKILLN